MLNCLPVKLKAKLHLDLASSVVAIKARKTVNIEKKKLPAFLGPWHLAFLWLAHNKWAMALAPGPTGIAVPLYSLNTAFNPQNIRHLPLIPKYGHYENLDSNS